MRQAIPWPEGQAEKFLDVDRVVVQPFIDRMIQDPRLHWRFEQRAFMVHGIDSVFDYFKLATEYTIAPGVREIECPALVACAESDHIAGFAGKRYAELECKKTLIRFLDSEGAGEHCEANACTLYHQRVYDCLDDQFSA